MKIEVNEDGEIVFSDVFNAIGIKTDIGTFGVCQRDGGLEVVFEGETVFEYKKGKIDFFIDAVGNKYKRVGDAWVRIE